MIEGALTQKPKPMGPNARFGYPLRGGFQALMNGFLPFVKDRLLLNTRVPAVSPSRRTATFSDGSVVAYERLISTMPLPSLIRAMGDEVPASIREAASGLRHTSVRCVNIGVERPDLTEKHWIYYPEETVFHRIFVQGNASPHCNPAGGFGITCEITYGPLKPLPCDGEALIQRCIDDCVKVGMFDASDPIWAANQVDMPFAYPSPRGSTPRTDPRHGVSPFPACPNARRRIPEPQHIYRDRHDSQRSSHIPRGSARPVARGDADEVSRSHPDFSQTHAAGAAVSGRGCRSSKPIAVRYPIACPTNWSRCISGTTKRSRCTTAKGAA